MGLSPNNWQALEILQGVYLRQEDWGGLERVLEQMRRYLNCPVGVYFLHARAVETLGNPAHAASIYDEISITSRFSSLKRNQAALYAGMLRWRAFDDAQGAELRWQRIAGTDDETFGPLTPLLLGKTSPSEFYASLHLAVGETPGEHIYYSLGIAAWMLGDRSEAAGYFGKVIAESHANQLKPHDMTLIEWWALMDLEKISGQLR